MSGMYGYGEAISQGNQFSARTKNYNDGVLAHNQMLQDVYKQKVKDAPGIRAGDTRQKTEDEVLYGFKDGSQGLSTGVGVTLALKGGLTHTGGFSGYMADETRGRLNTIGNTVRKGIGGAPKPPPVDMIPAEGTKVSLTAKPVLKPSQVGFSAAGEAGEAGAEAGADAGSSGIMTKGIKTVLGVVTGGKIGDAGLSTLSEVGGKAIGDFSGIVDVGKSIDNLVHHKSMFSGETTADKFQEAGSVLDIIGSVAPPLEIVGGALNLIGGVMDAYHDIKTDIEKKSEDAAAPPKPKLTSTKITPAFSSLGLIASAPISAKTSIVGSGSF